MDSLSSGVGSIRSLIITRRLEHAFRLVPTVLLVLAAPLGCWDDGDGGAPPVKGGLVGYWPFDETAGDTAHDSTGNGRDGTLFGDPTWRPGLGVRDGALEFDGDGDYVDIPDDGLIEGSSEFTVALWVKMQALEFSALVVKDELAAAPPFELAWVLNAGQYVYQTFQVRMAYETSWLDLAGGDHSCDDMEWHHVAVTFVADSQEGLRIYVDGVQSPENPTITVGMQAVLANGNPLRVGAGFGEPAPYGLQGLLDELRIYDTALSPEEVFALATSAPRVDAGPDQVVSFSIGTVALSGSAEDDGYPGPLATTWSVTDGPAVVTFSDEHAPVTNAAFVAPGVYVLRLTANDTANTSYDEVTITVSDATLPAVGIELVDGTASESGPNAGVFRITRTDALSGPLTVEYTVTGTADASDYQESLAGSVTMEVGRTSVDLTVTPVDDSEMELYEALTVTLSESPAYSISPSSSSATLTIEDNDMVVPEGLVGYWRFDEGSGEVAHDSSGFENHAMLLGGPTWATGVYGGGLSFDGVDDYVMVPRDSSLEPLYAITFALWANMSSTNDFSHCDLMRKAGHLESGVLLRWSHWDRTLQMRLDMHYGNLVYARDTQSNGTYLGEWHHFAGTYDLAAAKVCLYVDGLLRASSDGSFDRLHHSDDLFMMGQDIRNHGFAAGVIDEVRVYSRAITPAEVQVLAGQ